MSKDKKYTSNTIKTKITTAEIHACIAVTWFAILIGFISWLWLFALNIHLN